MDCSNSCQLPPEVIRLIIAASQIPLLYIWAVTTKWTRIWAAWELRNRHIDILKLFFKNADSFLKALGRFDGVIAGPVALAYFEGHPGIWPDTCNIHIPFQHYEAFLTYVQDMEEYVVDNSPKALLKNQEMVLGTQLSGTPHRGSGIHAVTSLKRHLNIRVIQSKSRAAAYPLPRSLSTLEMCFLSVKGFCCPYPGPTSEGFGLLNMHHTDFGTDTSTTISSSTDDSDEDESDFFQHDNAAPVLPDDISQVEQYQPWYTVISANDCYYSGSHRHALDKYCQRVADERWVEGKFVTASGEESHSLCPCEIRSFTDDCCLTVAFLNKDPPKDSLYDPVFAITHHNVLPNSKWAIEWRLGGFRKYIDGRLEIVAGWTRTILVVNGSPQHIRVMLHIPDHRTELNTELINNANNSFGEEAEWDLIGESDDVFEDVEFQSDSDSSDSDNNGE